MTERPHRHLGETVTKGGSRKYLMPQMERDIILARLDGLRELFVLQAAPLLARLTELERACPVLRLVEDDPERVAATTSTSGSAGQSAACQDQRQHCAEQSHRCDDQGHLAAVAGP